MTSDILSASSLGLFAEIDHHITDQISLLTKGHHIKLQVKHRESQDGRQKSSCTEFLRQMAFREYSRYLSFHFPFTHERSLLEHLRAAPWKFDHRHFKVRQTPQQSVADPNKQW